MIKHLLYIVSILIVISSCSKEAPAPEQVDSFVKFYGETSVTKGVDVKQLPDGGYIAIGTTLTPANDSDIYLIKVDKFGNKVWDKNIGTSNNETANSLVLLDDGNVIIQGNTSITSTVSNIFLVKADGNGDIQWSRTIGGTESIKGYCIQKTKSNEFVIAGSYKNSSGFKNAMILFTDNSGNNPDYVKTTSAKYNNEASYVIELNEGGYMFIGYSQSSIASYSGVYIDVVSENKILKNLSINYGIIGDYGNCIKQINDTIFYFLATTLTKDSGSNISIAKLKHIDYTSDSIFWERTIGGKGNDYGKSIELLTNRDISLTGIISNTDNTQSIVLAKFNANGTQISYVKFGNFGNQTAEKIVNTADNGFVIVGTNTIKGNSVLSLIKVNNSGGL